MKHVARDREPRMKRSGLYKPWLKPQKNVYGPIYLTRVLVSLKSEDGSTWIEWIFYVDDKTLH